MRKIGPHLRLTSSLADLFLLAQSQKLETFQCFLIDQNTHRSYSPSQQEIDRIRNVTTTGIYFLHASYTINLAEPSHERMRTFFKEITTAVKVGFTHYVLHPGSCKFAKSKEHAIAIMAQRLDSICKEDLPLKIVLENVAHGGKAIGGDLHDFFLLKQAMNYPKSISFCIDTAHAFVYGYDITTTQGQALLYEQIETYLGCDTLALIHCNDTTELVGSKIDQHEPPGGGVIGMRHLHDFTHHPALAGIPIIMELPDTGGNTVDEFKTVLSQWRGV